MKGTTGFWNAFLFCFENSLLTYFWDVLIGLIPTNLETGHRTKPKTVVFALVTHSAPSAFPSTHCSWAFATYPETALGPGPPVTPISLNPVASCLSFSYVTSLGVGGTTSLPHRKHCVHWASRSPIFLGVLHTLLLLSSIPLSL